MELKIIYLGNNNCLFETDIKKEGLGGRSQTSLVAQMSSMTIQEYFKSFQMSNYTLFKTFERIMLALKNKDWETFLKIAEQPQNGNSINISVNQFYETNYEVKISTTDETKRYSVFLTLFVIGLFSFVEEFGISLDDLLYEMRNQFIAMDL